MVTRAQFFILVTLISVTACRYSRVPLRIKRTDQSENLKAIGMRTDGVYIEKLDKGHLIFYKNGIIRGWTGASYYSIDGLLNEYELNPTNYIKLPYIWGVYKLDGDSLQVEKWYSNYDGFFRYPSKIYHGTVLDSVTIELKGYSHGGTIFHFYPLKNKPDSSNRFIK